MAADAGDRRPRQRREAFYKPRSVVANVAPAPATHDLPARAQVRRVLDSVCGTVAFANAMVRSNLDTFSHWEVITKQSADDGYVHTIVARAVYNVAGSSSRDILAIKLVDVDRRPGDFELGATELRQREWRLSRALADCPGLLVVSQQHWHGPTCLSVSPFVGAGDLFAWLSKRENHQVDESTARAIFDQIMTCVGAMHARQYAHRDIKLENVFYNEVTGEARLGDIEFACSVAEGAEPDEVFNAKCGSFAYVAPEIWLATYTFGAPSAYANKLAADIWACGVVLYALLFGLFPFDVMQSIASAGAAAGSRKIAKAALGSMMHGLADEKDSVLFGMAGATPLDESRTRLAFPESAPKEATSLLASMLQLDPSHRVTAVGALAHPWLLGRNAESTLSLAQSLPALGTGAARESVPAHAVKHLPVAMSVHFPPVGLYERSDSVSKFIQSMS